jgi:GT2 family glycosyltransferase
VNQLEPVSVSIVSHGHGALVANLLRDLSGNCSTALEVLLTLNVPEDPPGALSDFRFPVRLIRNDRPKGFGANHNAAFRASTHDLFCVLNPDIRLTRDPFPPLAQRLSQPKVAVVAPLIRSPDGTVEASARPFPTPFEILRKALLGPPPPYYGAGETDLHPDWVGGMFMLFRRDAFKAVGGFDERYHLYYEDVDLCARMRLAGKEVILCRAVDVAHDARRESHRNLRYLAWHVVSMLRFFLSRPFLHLVVLRRGRSESFEQR